MHKGVRFSGEFGSIIQDRARPSNFHIADRNGRVYLCNCCACMRVNNKPKYPTVFKNSKKIKLYRSLLTGKLKVWG